MMKCVDCSTKIEKGYLCDSCFRIRLQNKIMNEDRVVESPHASWF